ncbi:glucokinase [Clostridium tepidiprofundi DSM 19306]|uniref:Glucokinase n=1 Tax=Clostridium tepidiprofundi DSM 19306 TaxID=1121338 RepID=A0A151B7M1_9CLOT|nr:ROK family glucokinase [Clostridium tepidiprofundi]KYH35732.1 glucokinase [Clostridium tepidiprofundi DSM 19306]
MFIGVDLGGTNIAAGLVDAYGKLLHNESIPTYKEREAYDIICDIEKLITKIIDKAGTNKSEIESIGIGIPGLADECTGDVIECVNLNWHNVPLRSILEKKIGVSVYINNDATVAALAEYEAGIMKGVRNGVFITLGTGVGGGIIIDGKVYTGSNGIGSEIGHMIVGENYYNCNCGRNGCLETFSSSTALINYTKKLLQENNEESILNVLSDGNINNIDGKMIFDAAKQGDKLANKAVDRMVKYLSIGIMNIVSIIDPEIFVIGGGLSKAGTFLLEKIQSSVLDNRYFKSFSVGKITIAKLGNEAGIIGAAMLGKNNNID